jgi:hypothetical protein
METDGKSFKKQRKKRKPHKGWFDGQENRGDLLERKSSCSLVTKSTLKLARQPHSVFLKES